jgi:hypothetical protein
MTTRKDEVRDEVARSRPRWKLQVLVVQRCVCVSFVFPSALLSPVACSLASSVRATADGQTQRRR